VRQNRFIKGEIGARSAPKRWIEDNNNKEE
jgi:hypothetical protein